MQSPARVSASSVVLAFDERPSAQPAAYAIFARTLAATLRRLKEAEPSVVAIDTVLADAIDANTDTELDEGSGRYTKCDSGQRCLPGVNRWEDPLPHFESTPKAVGHVHAAPDPVIVSCLWRWSPATIEGGRWRWKLTALRSGGLR